MLRSCTAILVALSCLDRTAAAQTISDRVRQAKARSETEVVFSPVGEPRPMSIEQLTKQADVIVLATVRRLSSHPSASDTSVLTEYHVMPTRVLAGSGPAGATKTPGQSTPFVLAMGGGEFVRDGITVKSYNFSLALLKDGIPYLLFLKRFGTTPGQYELVNYGAFEVSAGNVRPLVASGEDVYREFITSFADLTSRVAQAAGAK